MRNGRQIPQDRDDTPPDLPQEPRSPCPATRHGHGRTWVFGPAVPREVREETPTGGHVRQPSEGERPLPAEWAFVVQFHVGTEPAQGRIMGRVEHVVSGQAAHFDMLEDLLRFIPRVLTGLRAESPAEPPEEPGSEGGAFGGGPLKHP